jgi:hypothetical protein
MGKLSRTKGHTWERRVAKELTQATGLPHKRVLTETRDGNSGDVRAEYVPVVYQCKCGAQPDIYGAVQEAAAAAGATDYAVAAIHRTGRGGEYLAVMPWADWLDIVRRLAHECRWGPVEGDA